MAKSLKNFITIRQALKIFTPRQLRLLFLMQSWDNVMVFEDSAVEEVKVNNFILIVIKFRINKIMQVREKSFKEFFLTVEATLRDQRGISQVLIN